MFKEKLRELRGEDANEIRKRFHDKYPVVYRVINSFAKNPFSGNALKIAVKGDEVVVRDENLVQSLSQPRMWNDEAPVVISQFGGYGSEEMAAYWNTTLPDIEERYSSVVRYEHYDAPVMDQGFTEYQLATIGRVIQDACGDEAFWEWFNSIMVDGVQSITEGYELVDGLNMDVTGETVKEAVEYDLYEPVIWSNANSLFKMCDESREEKFSSRLREGESVFAVFVNGVEVQPTYGSMVGSIETHL